MHCIRFRHCVITLFEAFQCLPMAPAPPIMYTYILNFNQKCIQPTPGKVSLSIVTFPNCLHVGTVSINSYVPTSHNKTEQCGLKMEQPTHLIHAVDSVRIDRAFQPSKPRRLYFDLVDANTGCICGGILVSAMLTVVYSSSRHSDLAILAVTASLMRRVKATHDEATCTLANCPSCEYCPALRARVKRLVDDNQKYALTVEAS
jgi:hypothetical protein